MANRVKGEISAEHEGVTYTLRLNMNTIAEIEDDLNESWALFEGRLAAGTARVKHMRSAVLHALRVNHPDATSDLAGELMSEDAELFVRLYQAAFPAPEKSEETPEGNGEAAA